MKYSLLSTALLMTLSSSIHVKADTKVTNFPQWSHSSFQASEEQRVTNKVSEGYRSTIDFSDLNQNLLSANDAVVVSLPLPNGELVNFRLTPTLTMAPDLAARYPSIKTFSGVQIDNPENKGNFDVTPHGFHGFFRLNGQDVFIEPQFLANNEEYVSYYKKDALSLNANSVNKRLPPIKKLAHNDSFERVSYYKKSSSTLRTYRIAVAADGEYTAFHGGTKELGLAAVVTMINRINEVYERDLAIKLELVADNDKIIYTNAATDPYANDDTDIDKNTSVLDKEIGNDNYDIGHIVGTGGGGVAGFGVVCDASAKGEGLTGSDQPTGDAFFIDFVAHEIGHQFRADHTFNGASGSCEDNRENLSSYEPGSASSIMGYAGLCDGQNLQDNSDPYFHTHSISQISQFVASGGGSQCGQSTDNGNKAPVVDAGNDFIIPSSTPFKLSGSATDADQDTLSYSWEQYDLGPQSNTAAQQVDDGKRPLFRMWTPTAQPVRVFPKMASILANKLEIGETYPTTTREMNFRLLTRDGKGGVNFDTVKINVIKADEAFAVIAPNAESQWSGTQQKIRWNVANTNQSPISCAAVDITLSLDGGQSFEHKLAEKVANNGNFDANLPVASTTKARVKVSCSDNIFFAISNGDFSIDDSTATTGSLKILGVKTEVSTNEDTAVALTPSMFNYQSSQADSINILGGVNYQVLDGKVVPNLNFNGELSVKVSGLKAGVESDIVTIKITVVAVNDNPEAGDDTAEVNENSTSNMIDVLANDSDVDEGDNLTLSSVNYSGSGTLKIENNQINYVPAQGFSGKESATYNVSDSNGGSADGNLIITVKANNVVVPPVVDNTSKSGGSLSGWVILFLVSVVSCVMRRKEF